MTLTKDEIYVVDPRFSHLETFVNRVEQCQKFTSAVELNPRERANNFFAFYGSSGVGKSWLMYRLHFECLRRKLTVARLKLENDRLNDPVRIMTELVEQLGESRFETWKNVRQFWNSIFGPEPTNAGSTLNFSTQRDVNIHGDAVAGNVYQISADMKTQAQRNPEEYKSALTQNFLKDLSDLLQREPVIFLLDNFDSDTLAPQTREWMMENLLDKPRSAKGYGVLAVITSSREMDSSMFFDIFENETHSDEILPLERQHIIEYMRAKKIPDPIIEKEVDSIIQRTHGVPKKVSEELALIKKALETMKRSGTQQL